MQGNPQTSKLCTWKMPVTVQVWQFWLKDGKQESRTGEPPHLTKNSRGSSPHFESRRRPPSPLSATHRTQRQAKPQPAPAGNMTGALMPAQGVPTTVGTGQPTSQSTWRGRRNFFFVSTCCNTSHHVTREDAGVFYRALRPDSPLRRVSWRGNQLVQWEIDRNGANWFL